MPSTINDLSIRDDTVVAQCGQREVWRVRIGDVAVLGEMTFDAWGDDHFFVLVEDDGKWSEIPSSVAGLDAVLEAVHAKWAMPFTTLLANSVVWATTVLCPPALRGQPLLELHTLPQPWWRRLLGMGPSREMRLSPVITSYLEQQRAGLSRAK